MVAGRTVAPRLRLDFALRAYQLRRFAPAARASSPLGDFARRDRGCASLHAMIRYVARRLALAVPTLAGIVVLVFLLLHLAPGSPVSALGAESGRRVSGRAAAEMRRLYGLDRPLPERFVQWIGRVVRFDLGESFVDRRPVAVRIREALPYTLTLNGLALLLTLALAIPLGVEAGGHPESAFDRISGAILFALYSTPSFWAALLLQTLFSVRLRWLPLYGVASDAEPSGLAGLADRISHLALPVVCLTYGSLAFYARLVRAGVAEARSADYVLAARARGLSRREALWKHAFRNALLPLITLLGLVLPGLLSGSVIIERIFAWPGLGRLYFDSILSRDYPVVLALSLVGAVATLAVTLAADIAYAMADPRVRDGTASRGASSSGCREARGSRSRSWSDCGSLPPSLPQRRAPRRRSGWRTGCSPRRRGTCSGPTTWAETSSRASSWRRRSLW